MKNQKKAIIEKIIKENIMESITALERFRFIVNLKIKQRLGFVLQISIGTKMLKILSGKQKVLPCFKL